MAVVVPRIAAQDPFEMAWIHGQEMVEALRSDRSREPLGVTGTARGWRIATAIGISSRIRFGFPDSSMMTLMLLDSYPQGTPAPISSLGDEADLTTVSAASSCSGSN
jgi:hypothetical protein